MKRRITGEHGDPAVKHLKLTGSRYPNLRPPPQRKLMPKAFSTAVKNGTSLFEKLPAEIHNYINELRLVDKTPPLNIRCRTQNSLRPIATVHSLTQVSRSIRAETVTMFHSHNAFAFQSLLDS